MRVIVINPKARTVEELDIPDEDQAAHDKIKELCSADLIQSAGFTPEFDGVRNVMWVDEEGKLKGPVNCFVVEQWGSEHYAGVAVIDGFVNGVDGFEHGSATMPIEEIRKRVSFIGLAVFY